MAQESPPSVVYEGQKCPTCSGPIVLFERAATAELFCESCGVIRSIMFTRCKSERCRMPIFYRGKVPISIRTGSSHFIDCVDAPAFRKNEAKAASLQGGFGL